MDEMISIIIVLLFLSLFIFLQKLYNRKYKVPAIFSWFPGRFGIRKVNEHLSQMNKELAAQGIGIWVTYYAVDLYFITVPLKISKYKN
ncbi:hypothetical protein [Fictibacillus phosphorivorans]|nr:hypothetical protein [Fictibacillus phosphorivorans]